MSIRDRRRGFGRKIHVAAAAALMAAPSLPSYGSMPTASTFAQSPKAGYRVIMDDVSLGVWGLSYGTAVSGDGVVALDDNTGIGSVRDQLYKFAATTGNAWVAEELRFSAHGKNRDASDWGDTSLAAGFWQCEFLPVAGECVFLRAMASTVQQFRLGIADAGGGAFFLVLNNAVIGAARSYGTMLKVRVSWDAAGNFVIQSATTGSWRTEFSDTGLAPSAIDRLYWGVMGATKATDLRFSATAISDVSFAEMDVDVYISGSGVRDVVQDEVAAALFCPDGLFAGATQARIRYATGSDPTGGTAGSWVAFSGNRERNILPISQTGLTSGTAYSLQFEVGDVSNNVIYTSDAYRFRTLAAAGVEQAAQIAYASCHFQTPVGHPYRDDQYILDEAGEFYRGTLHLGDQGYEMGGPPQILEPYLDGFPPETPEEFERQLREFCNDFVLHATFKRGTYSCTPDDHQWMNDADGNTAPGGSEASTLANAWPGRRSDDYGAGTTLADLYTAGLTDCFDPWWTNHFINAPTPGVRYTHWVDGCVERILLDDRVDSIARYNATNNYISTTQMTWLQDRIDNLEPTTTFLVIAAQAAIADYSAKPGEGWEAEGLTQFRAFLDYLIANVPSTVQVVFPTGDDHVGYALHRVLTTPTNPTLPANFLGEIRCSAGATMIFRTSLTSASWKFDQSTVAATDAIIRGSGVMFNISDDASTIDLGVYMAGSERTHNLYTAPAPDTTAPTITSANTASVQENSPLSHALTADETVTWSIVGGADAADCEISGTTLRWTSNGTKDFETPDDADTNNTYVVTVRATDTATNTTDQTITITVTDEAVEGGGYTFTNSVAEAYVTAMSTEPDDTRKALIDDLFVSLAADGILAKLDLLYIPAMGTDQAARLNAITPASYALTGTATFTTDRGLTGNGTNIVSTGLNADAATYFLQTDASMFAWVNSAGSTGAVLGIVGSTNIRINPRDAGGLLTVSVNETTTFQPATASRAGFSSVTRTGSTRTVHKDGTQIGTSGTVTSAARPATPLVCLGGNTGYATDRLAAFGFGGYLTNTEIGDLYDALNTFLTAIGAQ